MAGRLAKHTLWLTVRSGNFANMPGRRSGCRACEQKCIGDEPDLRQKRFCRKEQLILVRVFG